jgi:hypothetical protein
MEGRTSVEEVMRVTKVDRIGGPAEQRPSEHSPSEHSPSGHGKE